MISESRAFIWCAFCHCNTNIFPNAGLRQAAPGPDCDWSPPFGKSPPEWVVSMFHLHFVQIHRSPTACKLASSGKKRADGGPGRQQHSSSAAATAMHALSELRSHGARLCEKAEVGSSKMQHGDLLFVPHSLCCTSCRLQGGREVSWLCPAGQGLDGRCPHRGTARGQACTPGQALGRAQSCAGAGSCANC